MAGTPCSRVRSLVGKLDSTKSSHATTKTQHSQKLKINKIKFFKKEEEPMRETGKEKQRKQTFDPCPSGWHHEVLW